MSIGESLLPEFDYEMKTTRTTLERVPDDKLKWQPHAKSMAMGRLASHIAELPGWATLTMEHDSFNMAPPGEAPRQPANLGSRAEMLELFDKNVGAARAALASCSDERMMGTWSLLAGEHTLMSMPRVAVLRTWVVNHVIHHRAQLGVYLRLNDLPVPSVYGPSADEGKM